MSDRLKKVGMFSTDSNFCFSTWVREVVQRSVELRHLIQPQQPQSSFARIQYNWIRYHHCQPPFHSKPLQLGRLYITTLTANADIFLQDFERKKLNRTNNTRADPPVPGKAVIGDLLRSNRLLIPITIDANGRLGPMFQYTLYGTITIPPSIPPRKQFKLNRPYAKAMYKRATSIPAPCGILLEADNNWKHTQKTQNHTTILWSLIYGSNTIYHYNPTNRYWHRTRSQLFNLESNPKL
jgi:hypothetical protein